MTLGILACVATAMAEMAEVCLIFASYRFIWEVDCFGPSSGPECTESDFENVSDG
jgi:hypothetical protein